MPDCDKDAWYEFRPDGVTPLSLHDYVEVDVIPNCTVQILKCRTCGKISIGYWKNSSLDCEEDNNA